jgi:predicted Holliday junction resolvase-like endonuclease
MLQAMTDTIAAGLLGFGLGVALMLVGFLLWRASYTRAIRQDAIRRSQAVVAGRVQEQLVPHLPGFAWNPRDARFLGSPVDYLVFDGLAAGEVSRVIFLEIKTGGAVLSPRERQVRQAVLDGRVEWEELRL